jgi:hypothetical protein
MTAPAKNPLPFTVSANAGPLAIAELGLREVIAGGALIANATLFEVIPDMTVIVASP